MDVVNVTAEVVDEAGGTTPHPAHLQGIERDLPPQMCGHRPADAPPAEGIHDYRQT